MAIVPAARAVELRVLVAPVPGLRVLVARVLVRSVPAARGQVRCGRVFRGPVVPDPAARALPARGLARRTPRHRLAGRRAGRTAGPGQRPEPALAGCGVRCAARARSGG